MIITLVVQKVQLSGIFLYKLLYDMIYDTTASIICCVELLYLQVVL